MKKLEIHKENLKYNLDLIKNKLNGKADIIAVVKANGMGLDLIQYTSFLKNEGINFFAVANTIEAVSLRNTGINDNILMMSEVNDITELTELIENDIILTIGTLEEKEKIESLAISLNKKVRAHVKIDTGFARYRFYL